MKPMLAVNAELSALRFPMIASPKLDGVRALNVNGKLLSRKFIAIPNNHTRERFGGTDLSGLDGELIVGPPTGDSVLRTTNSAVSRIEGTPDVKFYAFDIHNAPSMPFTERIKQVRKIAARNPHVVVVVQHTVNNIDELAQFEATCIEMGFEGVILRTPNSPYKHGRSTLNEAYMLKVKRWSDSEAVVVTVNEERHNGNAAGVDNLGRTKRSSHAENKVGKNTLGSFTVRDLTTGVEFDCSPGSITAVEGMEMWKWGDRLIGKVIKYKFIAYGVKDKPKYAQFVSFREQWDM